MFNSLLLPITSFKLRYIPIVAIYFCYGFSTVTNISELFWTKEFLTLTTQQLIQISFWGSLPWTIKLVFSQFIENINILGSRRKSYVIIGALLTLFGAFMVIAVANNYPVTSYGSTYSWLLCSAMLMTTGFVIQDLVGDTLCAELVLSSSEDEEEYKREIGIIQIIGRISLMSGIFIGTGIGGYLAEHYSFSFVSMFSLISPMISIIGIFFLSKDIKVTEGVFNFKIMILAILLGVVSAIPSVLDSSYAVEISFLLNFIVIIILFKIMMAESDCKTRKELIVIGIMIFFSRLSPQLGYAVSWWKIDELHFGPQFMATLSQTGNLFGLLGSWIFANVILKRDIGYIIILLTLIKAALCIPEIAMSFGLHHWTNAHFGFGAHSIALVDEAMTVPLNIILMAPTLALAVYYAPKVNKTTWLALTACFLNLSLSGSFILGKWLNSIFIIERGNYGNISNILISDFIITLIVPILAVLICNKYRVIKSNI